MRGFLGQLRSAVAVPGTAACAPCSARGSGNAELDVALRRVTHSESAAVPSEVLHEAVRLASESEDSLAGVLRHVEENIGAPQNDWRRIHGALALLERLLKPGQAVAYCSRLDCDDALVGRIWYEAKVRDRIAELAHFTYAEDPRVALLIRRVSLNVQNAAQRFLESDSDEGCSTSPCSRGGGSARSGTSTATNAAAGDGGGATGTAYAPKQRLGTPREGAVEIQVEPAPVVLGRRAASSDRSEGLEEEAAAVAKNLRSTSAALNALRDSGLREGRGAAAAVAAADAKKRSSAAADSAEEDGHPSLGASPHGPRFCCCCRRRRPVAGGETSEAEAEADLLLL